MGDDDRLYVAVDLGAGSGRVFLAGFRPQELMLEEIRRFRYPPRQLDGHLRWDAKQILAEIEIGLRSAAERARELRRPVHSLGIDSWGVDYGLLDASGRLLEDPICYRDRRTDGIMDAVFERVPRDELFARTGIQLMQINTLFQLFAHARRGLPAAVAHLLLVPDLMSALLTGRTVTEFSIGSTTQMFDARAGTWDEEIVRRLELPRAVLSPVVPSGTALGPLLPAVASETALVGTCVVAPAAHDTGSAVAGAPLQPRWAYISSGTWSLVGIERASVLIDAAVARHNFTNEGGACGTIRFLRNVTGLWILESCRQEWRERGATVDYDDLLHRASSLDAAPGLIFPDDPRFLNPPSMVAAIGEQMAESGQATPSDPATLTRVILDSLAFRYASVLRTIEALTSTTIDGVQIVGGGSQNHYLNEATATATGKTVLAGPIEAAAIGNAVVQAISAGRFASLADGRSHVERHVRPARFGPKPTAAWERAARLYASIEAQFSRSEVTATGSVT